MYRVNYVDKDWKCDISRLISRLWYARRISLDLVKEGKADRVDIVGLDDSFTETVYGGNEL